MSLPHFELPELLDARQLSRLQGCFLNPSLVKDRLPYGQIGMSQGRIKLLLLKNRISQVCSEETLMSR